MLDRFLIERDRITQPEYRKKKSPLRPSSAGECARKLAHMYREHLGLDEVVVEDRKPEIVRLLSLGHYIESHILRFYRDCPDVDAHVYNQQTVGVVEYEDGSLTEGQIDMCLRTDDHLGVGDAKSKGDKFSKTHKSKWDEDADKYATMKSVVKKSNKFFWIPNLAAFLRELKDPFFAMNFQQVNAYIWSTFLQRRGADHGTIIQYNKNDSRMREFRFRPSKEVYEYVEDKFKGVKENAENNLEAVPKEFSLGSVKCAFCPYSSTCWPGQDSKQAFFATFPKKDWPRDTSYLGMVGDQLEELYEAYKEAVELVDISDSVEARITRLMQTNKVKKVRFSDGAIFELKYLKTPRPHVELRRSKL